MILNEKHYKVINLLIEGHKITEIAKSTKISRQAIYNMLNDDVFKAELDKQRQEIRKRGQDKILGKFDIYIDKIHEIALNSQSDNVKLNALEFLVEHVIGKATTKIEQSIEDKDKEQTIDIDNILDDLDGVDNVIELEDRVAK